MHAAGLVDESKPKAWLRSQWRPEIARYGNPTGRTPIAGLLANCQIEKLRTTRRSGKVFGVMGQAGPGELFPRTRTSKIKEKTYLVPLLVVHNLSG